MHCSWCRGAIGGDRRVCRFASRHYWRELGAAHGKQRAVGRDPRTTARPAFCPEMQFPNLPVGHRRSDCYRRLSAHPGSLASFRLLSLAISHRCFHELGSAWRCEADITGERSEIRRKGIAAAALGTKPVPQPPRVGHLRTKRRPSVRNRPRSLFVSSILIRIRRSL